MGERVLDGLSQFKEYVTETSEEATTLLVRKHMDYGPKNIMDSPFGPMQGLTVRLYDKIARLQNLLKSGNPAEYESLRDTFIDISNYGLIGVMVLDGKFEVDIEN